MLGNIAFTLYEIFGYLLPGNVALLAILVLYWGLFVPKVPLGLATYQIGMVTWTAVAIASYFLGHAVQGLGNFVVWPAEENVLAGKGDTAWMRRPAFASAAKLLGVNANELKELWVVRALDEYSVQAGNLGERDVFVYREGFYRGAAIALFFLSLALVFRFLIPGTSIQFTKGLYYVSGRQLLFTAFLLAFIARIYVRRYRRFAQYRVARAVVAGLVHEQTLAEGVQKHP